MLFAVSMHFNLLVLGLVSATWCKAGKPLCYVHITPVLYSARYVPVLGVLGKIPAVRQGRCIIKVPCIYLSLCTLRQTKLNQKNLPGAVHQRIIKHRNRQKVKESSLENQRDGFPVSLIPVRLKSVCVKLSVSSVEQGREEGAPLDPARSSTTHTHAQQSLYVTLGHVGWWVEENVHLVSPCVRSQ